jgi:Trypsin
MCSFTCSTGVGIDYNGTKYMLTAAHCFDPGSTLNNLQNWNDIGSNTYMGKVHSDDTSDKGDDIGLTTITPSGDIWTGPIGHAVSKPIYGWGTNPDGFDVYNEGAASGQLEAQVINNGYGCLYDLEGPPNEGTRTACNLTWAYGINVGYGAANQKGDSGGPVIRYTSNGHLLVTGIVSAAPTNSKTTCRYNTATTCYRGL